MNYERGTDCAIRAFLYFEKHCYNLGMSWYEVKQAIVRDAVRQFWSCPQLDALPFRWTQLRYINPNCVTPDRATLLCRESPTSRPSSLAIAHWINSARVTPFAPATYLSAWQVAGLPRQTIEILRFWKHRQTIYRNGFQFGDWRTVINKFPSSTLWESIKFS